MLETRIDAGFLCIQEIILVLQSVYKSPNIKDKSCIQGYFSDATEEARAHCQFLFQKNNKNLKLSIYNGHQRNGLSCQNNIDNLHMEIIWLAHPSSEIAMSHAACPTCKNLVNTGAKACPKCGQRDPAGSEKRQAVRRAVFGLCVMAGAGSYLYFVQLPQLRNLISH